MEGYFGDSCHVQTRVKVDMVPEPGNAPQQKTVEARLDKSSFIATSRALKTYGNLDAKSDSGPGISEQ